MIRQLDDSEPGFGHASLIFWDLETGEAIRAYQFGAQVNSIKFSPDGTNLPSGLNATSLTGPVCPRLRLIAKGIRTEAVR